MGESAQHFRLVELIVQRIQAEHAANSGLSILVDSGPVASQRRPGRIGGYTPDVYARTVPSSFVVIGEAKSFGDLYQNHTALQLSAFLAHLRLEAHPLLIVATPLAAVGAARSLVRRIQRAQGATQVPAVFLHG